MTDNRTEWEFLEDASHTYVTSESAQDRLIRSLVVRTFVPFLRGGHGLEMGCSDGYMTELLAAYMERLDVVDGSERFLARARGRGIANARFFHALFEEFVSGTEYDAIFACFVLEHVADVQAMLRMARAALKPFGLLFVAVPNARALSRQLARHMGLLSELTDLTENDHNHGHRRVYDRTALNRELETAQFENVAQGGILLKPFADFQMDKLIDLGIVGEAQVDGLYKLGLEHSDLCGTLFSVCRPRHQVRHISR
jgi:2-polyprenyl-3-methyl-5-hydroxy-6-metoxy-1,4-benzoquinol methylase